MRRGVVPGALAIAGTAFVALGLWLAGETPDGRVVTLRPVQGLPVSGPARRPHGSPAAGVDVAAHRGTAGIASVRAGDDGTFRSPGLPRGRYRLAVQDSGGADEDAGATGFEIRLQKQK